MKQTEISMQKQEQQEQTYSDILDKLFIAAGGKEFCLKQIIDEYSYSNFAREFKSINKIQIYQQIKNLYTCSDEYQLNDTNIIELEISSACWNKHILYLYYFDKQNLKIIEYSIKTNATLFISLYDGEQPIFSRSFLSKIKNGSNLWNSIETTLAEKII